MSWSCKIFICSLWMALQFETYLNNNAHMSNVCVIWQNLHAFTWVWDTVRHICIVLYILHISRSNITRNPYSSNYDNEHNMMDETLFRLSTQKKHPIICPYGGAMWCLFWDPWRKDTAKYGECIVLWLTWKATLSASPTVPASIPSRPQTQNTAENSTTVLPVRADTTPIHLKRNCTLLKTRIFKKNFDKIAPADDKSSWN